MDPDSIPLPNAATMLEPFYRNAEQVELESLVRNPVHVVLDNLRSAFNVGSIFRTSDAGAVEHLHLCGTTAYPPNPKLMKTALGAHAYVPWTYHATTITALEALKTQGIACVAIEAVPEAVSHTEFNWPRPVAIVFGNEVRGVAPEVVAQCEHTVRIPMHGYKNTINVATAYGVIMFEVLRRWRAL